MSWRGHFWTVYPHLRDRFAAPSTPAGRELVIRGEEHPITGILHRHPSSCGLVIVVHGLGGSADSGYVHRMANSAWQRSLSVLRLNMRGADGQTAGFYHAGLTQDLETLIAHPAIRELAPLYVIGFSLGGHVTLRYLAERHGGVQRAAAICPPLDLAAGCRHIDSPRSTIYRQHLLRGLRRMYRRASSLSEHSIPRVDVDRVRRVKDWDELIVAPHHGFASADDYYRRASVGPILDQIETPALLLTSDWDPMIDESAVIPHLERASEQVHLVRVRAGGHVGFPASFDAGLAGPPGLESQVLSWLASD